MPIYEYACEDCRKVSSVFVRSINSTPVAPNCSHCGGAQLSRKVSRVAVLHSRQDLHGDYDRMSAFDDAPGDDDYDDSGDYGGGDGFDSW